jgi:exosortase A-associated hydrolase 2
LSTAAHAPLAQPFFLPLEPGHRFCMLHAAGNPDALRGGCVFVPPFAEEMNKTRRMVAMQARALAPHGIAVLQIDLHGCGDSSGKFGEARVETWLRDIEAAVQWMHAHELAPVRLWGLRMGALMAARVAADMGPEAVEALLLWQPVVSGKSHLAQFLRVGVAAEMLSAEGRGQVSPRKRLQAGECIEVGGYEVVPALAEGMEALSLPPAGALAIPVDWFEVTPHAQAEPTPAAARLAAEWRAAGTDVELHGVQGEAFWSTVEITDCLPLVQRTTEVALGRWLGASTSTR